MSIEDTLKERGKTHGDWLKQSHLTSEIKNAINYRESYYEPMEACKKEALDMIAVKISRIVCGNSNEKDHWRDIQGYAKLAEGSCDD